MEEPALSVITPVYNSEKFLEQCLNNVIKQDCSSVEHIIVDGGSQDKTRSILLNYAERYSHIRWVSEKDQGQADAINKGIRMAKGQILGVLCVDDSYEPAVLSRVISLFQSLPEPTLLIGHCRVFDHNRQLIKTYKPQKLTPVRLLLDWNFASNPPVNPASYFYHKSLHEKIGYYDIREHYSLDTDFLIRAISKAHLKLIDEVLGNFYVHRQTKTYKAAQSGLLKKNKLRIRNKYREMLSPWQQWQVYILTRWEYFKDSLRKDGGGES